MTDPSLDRATSAIGELSSSVRTLTGEVVRSETLRGRKIKVIQHVLFILVPSVILLVVLAVSNFALLNRVNATAASSKSTNELLLGCLQPNTTCNKVNVQKTAALLDQIRQTQFVIAVCQRKNPVDTDPLGVGLIHCVQNYYPGFTLPTKTPGP